jgi:glycosyltransferase involved in cell wall biosynthesis
MRCALSAEAARFDLVHLHAVYLWPTWAGARAARTAAVPYVVSPRGMLVPELIRRKSRWVKSAWIALIDRANVEGAAAIYATSSVEARHLESFGWTLPPVTIVPHGVDDPPPASAPLSPDVAAAIADGPLVLAFGRINWEKGLDRLIAALPHVPSARVVVAGDDDEGHSRFLASEAKRLGVSQRVSLLARHVDGADKEALFGAAALFSMTSLSENFGLAAFEAMRRGLPVLATPDVGMSEIVRDIGAGLVVEPSLEGIATGLNALLSDAAKSRAMGEIGRKHVIANYGWPSVARRMDGLYRSILESRTRGRPGK